MNATKLINMTLCLCLLTSSFPLQTFAQTSTYFNHSTYVQTTETGLETSENLQNTSFESSTTTDSIQSTSIAPKEPDKASDGYYLISDTNELYGFASIINGANGFTQNTSANARLDASIAVNSHVLNADATLNTTGQSSFEQWIPIGNDCSAYTGNFDGQCYTISGLYHESSASYVGLFGSLKNGTVKNVIITDSFFSAATRVGGIVGANDGGTISHCSNSASVNGTLYVGGIVGANGAFTNYKMGSTSLSYCINSGAVHGSSPDTGGIIGYSYYNITSYCCNSGFISGNSANIGGIIGSSSYSTVSYCSNSGSLLGTLASVGGVIGESICTIVSHCCNSGSVDGNAYNASIIGYSRDSMISDCYFDHTVCPKDTIGPNAIDTIHSNLQGRSTADFTSGTVCSLLGDHIYCNGICTHCGAINPPAKNSRDVYELSNAGQLCWFANLVNGTLPNSPEQNSSAKAVLTGDIYMNDIPWTASIGQYNGGAFHGSFNGNKHIIYDLNQNTDTINGSRYPLFFTLSPKATVTNLMVSNASVWPAKEYNVEGSGVITKQNNGTISQCSVTNSHICMGNYAYLGGIAGLNNGAIEHCGVSNTTLSRQWGGKNTATMGGISEINNGTINNCYTYNCTFHNGTSSNAPIMASGNSPTNCYYYTSDIIEPTYGNSATDEDFQSGKITYSLNKQKTDGTQIWYQHLGFQNYPTFSGGTVYYGYEKRLNPKKIYSNEPLLENDGSYTLN